MPKIKVLGPTVTAGEAVTDRQTDRRTDGQTDRWKRGKYIWIGAYNISEQKKTA